MLASLEIGLTEYHGMTNDHNDILVTILRDFNISRHAVSGPSLMQPVYLVELGASAYQMAYLLFTTPLDFLGLRGCDAIRLRHWVGVE